MRPKRCAASHARQAGTPIDLARSAAVLQPGGHQVAQYFEQPPEVSVIQIGHVLPGIERCREAALALVDVPDPGHDRLVEQRLAQGQASASRLGRRRSPSRARSTDPKGRAPARRAADRSATRPGCEAPVGNRRTEPLPPSRSTARPRPLEVAVATATRAREPATTRASQDGSAGPGRARSGAAGACPWLRLASGGLRAAPQALPSVDAAGSSGSAQPPSAPDGQPARPPGAARCDEPCRPRPLSQTLAWPDGRDRDTRRTAQRGCGRTSRAASVRAREDSDGLGPPLRSTRPTYGFRRRPFPRC